MGLAFMPTLQYSITPQPLPSTTMGTSLSSASLGTTSAMPTPCPHLYSARTAPHTLFSVTAWTLCKPLFSGYSNMIAFLAAYTHAATTQHAALQRRTWQRTWTGVRSLQPLVDNMHMARRLPPYHRHCAWQRQGMPRAGAGARAATAAARFFHGVFIRFRRGVAHCTLQPVYGPSLFSITFRETRAGFGFYYSAFSIHAMPLAAAGGRCLVSAWTERVLTRGITSDAGGPLTLTASTLSVARHSAHLYRADA